jgi:hypothetical protein
MSNARKTRSKRAKPKPQKIRAVVLYDIDTQRTYRKLAEMHAAMLELSNKGAPAFLPDVLTCVRTILTEIRELRVLVEKKRK